MVGETLLLFIASLSHSFDRSFPEVGFQPQFQFEKYADPLPIPERILVNRSGKSSAELNMPMTQFQMKLHRDLPIQTVWGYAGRYPGPTIEVDSDQFLRVHWKNALPQKHIFPLPRGMDNGITRGLCLPLAPDVRTVTHLHGAEVSEPNPLDRLHNNDGWPDSWVTPGQEQIAEYPNHQSARTLWYHDHAMGTTGRNVAAGLAGAYIIHDSFERSLNLPRDQYDIPLMIQSHAFSEEGLLQYTNDITQEYYGNTVSVNGKLWPFLNVEPRKYRFRFVNAANARVFGMKLVSEEDETKNGPAFYQIGSDSGFLDRTVVLNDPANQNAPRLILAPGERADVIIDFSKYAGKNFLLHNNQRDGADGEIMIADLMLFKVAAQVTKPDHSRIPQSFQPIRRLKISEATQERKIVFAVSKTPSGEEMLTLNNKAWNDPIEEKPKLGSTEVWDLYNTLPDSHPFHLHSVQFQIVDRTPIDASHYSTTGRVTLAGNTVAPEANELGWKDTVRLPPFTLVRIIVRFEPFPGFYVYHCHNLEHEDMDMMRPFQIVK